MRGVWRDFKQDQRVSLSELIQLTIVYEPYTRYIKRIVSFGKINHDKRNNRDIT